MTQGIESIGGGEGNKTEEGGREAGRSGGLARPRRVQSNSRARVVRVFPERKRIIVV